MAGRLRMSVLGKVFRVASASEVQWWDPLGHLLRDLWQTTYLLQVSIPHLQNEEKCDSEDGCEDEIKYFGAVSSNQHLIGVQCKAPEIL